jgi:hypothetical protein
MRALLPLGSTSVDFCAGDQMGLGEVQTDG